MIALSGIIRTLVVCDVLIGTDNLFGIKSEFRGFGHSIFRQNYRYELTDEARNISRRIFTGNYFRHRSHSTAD